VGVALVGDVMLTGSVGDVGEMGEIFLSGKIIYMSLKNFDKAVLWHIFLPAEPGYLPKKRRLGE
jgi:hypothetical protein